MPLMMGFGLQGTWIVVPVFDQETGGQTLRTGVVIRLNKISHGSSTPPPPPRRGVFGIYTEAFDANE